jgi:PAT family beta-lactamase induction signal transducer AmpG
MSNLKSFYRWIPSLYFMEGLPFALVAAVPPVLYKNLNLANAKIAFYSSLFTLPWSLKPLLAPLSEIFVSKRTMVLLTQLLMAVALFVMAACLHFTDFFLLSCVVFLSIAFFSTMHDINADGFYIVNLDIHTQAHFIGIRSVCYQIGKLIGQGGLIILAGFSIANLGLLATWQMVLSLMAVVILVVAAYHFFNMPADKTGMHYAETELTNSALHSFKSVFRELVKLPHLFAIICFTLVYNLPEAQLIKILPLFLLDNHAHSGLGLTTAEVGIIYGAIGTAGILLGITLAGFILQKKTLKNCLLPITVFYGITNIGYWILSALAVHNLWWIGVLIGLAQFGYGAANGAYMLYLLRAFTVGKYPMSMYAIATSIMVLGITLGGALSGYMQAILGYSHFFLWILLVNVGMVVLAIYSAKLIEK